MKKIIAAFDGLDFSESTLEYATFISKTVKAHLVGVFLDDFTRMSESVLEVAEHSGGLDAGLKKIRHKDQITRDMAEDRFNKACESIGIEHSVHRDKSIAIQELLHESIYCDLLIIDAYCSFMLLKEKPPTTFLRELLSEVQCPVLVVPNNYYPINKIIYLYDGAPSSVHALKMFDYLLPQLHHLDTEVITVKPPEQSFHLPDNRLMKEFMKRHNPKAEFIVLKGASPKQQLLAYLGQPNNEQLIVLGAYQRSRISRWFKESMADVLLEHNICPLFIAHSK